MQPCTALFVCRGWKGILSCITSAVPVHSYICLLFSESSKCGLNPRKTLFSHAKTICLLAGVCIHSVGMLEKPHCQLFQLVVQLTSLSLLATVQYQVREDACELRLHFLIKLI